MMCARLLKKEKDRDRRVGLLNLFDRAFAWTTEQYAHTLRWSLRHQGLMLASMAMTLIATVALYIVVPKGFMPQQDTGLVTAILKAEPSASFERMQEMQVRLTNAFQKDRDVEAVVSVIGVGPSNLTGNTARLTLVLKQRDRRDRAAVVIARLEKQAAEFPGVDVSFLSVQEVQITTRASAAQYQYSLTGTDARDVTFWAQRLATEMARAPEFRDVVSEAQDGAARLLINIDRESASRLGVSVQAVSDALNNAFGQRQISTVYAQANQYRVILEAKPRYQQDINSLNRLYVNGTGGAQVPLSAIAKFEPGTAPLVIGHDEQFPAVTISFNVAPGESLGDAVKAIASAERTIAMPDSIIGRFTGDAAEFSRALNSQPWLILAAIVTIYIVLGVLYESAIHPITILSTLPSAGVGALLALLLCGLDLSIVALIGIVLLMGIVKKNAIMMIDFALDAEREQGLSPRAAIEKACLLRFRPIMMTTFAALFGALPLALGSGPGSELRIPLGVTIIGGLVLSQLLTLYTTPAMYLTLERIRRRMSKPASDRTDTSSAMAE
jgi:multidrug efflux pump